MQLDKWHVIVDTEDLNLAEATEAAVVALVETALKRFISVLDEEARTRSLSVTVTVSR